MYYLLYIYLYLFSYHLMERCYRTLLPRFSFDVRLRTAELKRRLDSEKNSLSYFGFRNWDFCLFVAVLCVLWQILWRVNKNIS